MEMNSNKFKFSIITICYLLLFVRGTCQTYQDTLRKQISYVDDELTKNGNSKLLLKAKGEIHYALGELFASKACFEKCIKHYPEDFECILNLGVLYQDLGRIDSSIIFYNQVIRIDENNVDALLGLSYNYYLIGDYDRAIYYCNEIIYNNANDPNAFNNRGLSYVKLGNFELAIEDFSVAINLKQGQVNYYYNRGHCYGLMGKSEEAIDDLTIALKIDPNNNYALSYMANVYLAIGKKKVACGYINQIREDILGLRQKNKCEN